MTACNRQVSASELDTRSQASEVELPALDLALASGEGPLSGGQGLAPVLSGGVSRDHTPDLTRRAAGLSAKLVALRESLWGPVILKSAGAAALLLFLSGLGAASILLEVGRGVPLPESSELVAALPSVWLAGVRASGGPEPSPVPSASQHSPAPQPSTSSAPADAGGAPGSAVTAEGKVILNRATASELMRLPGVGQKRAEAILTLRERLGRFRRATDLLRVKGIGPKSLQRMTPHFVLEPPTEGDAGPSRDPG